MSLRMVKLLVAEDHREQALEILDSHDVTPRWCMPVEGGRAMIDMILPAEGNEPILDDLEAAFRDTEEFRLLFFALEATLPRLQEKDSEEEDEGQGPSGGEDASRRPGLPSSLRTGEVEDEEKWVPSRINREELYADLADSSQASGYYLTMVALSSVVASAGLLLGDGAVIIGAMVIAPLIGPNLGVAFGTTLGDLRLGRDALLASFYGAAVAFAVALAAGVALSVDPAGSEIVGRTRLTYEHLALALAAGAAGAISLTRGVGTGLVGVMVAVALLPPLANAGLLLGDGHWQPGIGALVLVVGNVVCVNLAATVAFLAQGVRPNTWWEEERRTGAVWTASLLWGGLLVLLMIVIWFAWGGEPASTPG